MSRCRLTDLPFAACKEMESAPLSDLDRQIFDMSVRGCSVVEISLRCHCSTATVSRRRKAIIKRMGE